MTLSVQITEKRFGQEIILRNLSFTLEEGEVLAILGPSGIGKSTLLRILAGLDPDFDGHIDRPQRLAMVFQEPTLLPWRTALQNLTLTTGVQPDAAASALARVGLQGKEGFYPRQMSLGQQRRLSLARAYAARPRLLLLDEPFVSLDADLVEGMLTLTQDLIREQCPATVFVTHSATEARRLATRTLSLSAPAGQ